MTESKLQSLMVIDFSRKRPNEKGLLWSTRNVTFSVKDGQKQKAMGMVGGVSDLIYFKNDILTGIEVKFPGSAHNKDHIQIQYNWGKKITDEGGQYFIVTTLKGFWEIINNQTFFTTKVYTLNEISDLIKYGKSKIVF